MPTLTTRKPKAKSRSARASAKSAAKRRPGPSFSEGMKPFIGMIKNAPPDLSMREGFGD